MSALFEKEGRPLRISNLPESEESFSFRYRFCLEQRLKIGIDHKKFTTLVSEDCEPYMPILCLEFAKNKQLT